MRALSSLNRKSANWKKGSRFLTVLRRPGRSLRDLHKKPFLPLGLWTQYAAVAVFGSLLFGLSLVRVHPQLDPMGSSLWFTLSAGIAWILFGPLLRMVTGLAWRVLIQACLVTMVFGEVVLVTGACFQTLFGVGLSDSWGLWTAAGWILLSNLVMAAALSSQLAAVGISFQRSVLAWIFGLNGLGAACFFLLRDLAGGAV